MKTVNLNKAGDHEKLSLWLPEVKELEKKDRQAAIREYKIMVRVYPLSEDIYDRLMILFRQLKQPDEELLWIDRAIQTFEKSYAKTTNKKNVSSKINTLSRSILCSTGLVDKKGKALFQLQPIGRWQKRKELLKARLLK